ncbi:hypothetical protein CLOM_g22077 [Closterium sp. NIES-68]|nr:hypothetical protein CLOM_g22077 [Closterium sp. NIES-68]GJP63118.1 hypothetical protein CLOP_g20196 [Closterium sp. NIES-67]
MSRAPLSSDLLLAALAGTALGAAVSAAAFSATCFALSRPSTRANRSPPDPAPCHSTDTRAPNSRPPNNPACCCCSSSAQCPDGSARCSDGSAHCSRRRDSCARCANAGGGCAVGGRRDGGTTAGRSEAGRRMSCGAAEAPTGETGEADTIANEQAGAMSRQMAMKGCSMGGLVEGERKAEGGDGDEREESEREATGLTGEGTGKDHRRKHDPYDARMRRGYLSWDDYFMAMAFLSAQRSKDPNRQVGACIVGSDHVILGIGYNGFPRGIPDALLPWAKLSAQNDPLETKYPYVCHAEVNAVLNRNHASALDQRLYVTMFPCNDCAKVIIQAGIKEVIFFSDKPPTRNPKDIAYAASRKLLELAGVKVWQHRPQQESLTLSFS